jgi:hypothetical protein
MAPGEGLPEPVPSGNWTAPKPPEQLKGTKVEDRRPVLTGPGVNAKAAAAQ